jgi:iron complex transport system ATP-binding protein
MIRVEKLSLSLKQKPILRKINMIVQPGTCVGILGANGSGKTTLLRCLSGELQPQQGSIYLTGKDLSSYTPRQRARKIGVLTQELELSLSVTVEELVLMGSYPHKSWRPWYGKADYAQAEQVIKHCQLDHLRHQRFSQLSGGEKQRALWAKLLMQDPELLLLDEPTNHLDIRHQIRLLQWIRQLCQEGKTALIVLHDFNLAAQCCEQVLLLKEGRVTAQGSPTEVLQPEIISQTFGVTPLRITHPQLSVPQVLWTLEESKRGD